MRFKDSANSNGFLFKLRKTFKISALVLGILFTASPLSAFVRNSESTEDQGSFSKMIRKETAGPVSRPGILILKLKKDISKDSAKLLNELSKIGEIEEVRSVFPWRDSSAYDEDLEAVKQKNPVRQKRAASNDKTKDLPDLTQYVTVEFKNKNGDMKQAAESVQKSLEEYVDSVSPDYKMEVQLRPNDPFFNSSNSWGHQYEDLWALKPARMNLEPAWDLSQGQGIVVAVVDTGLDYNHPDIDQNVWTNPGEIPNNLIDDDQNGFVDDIRGWDFVNHDNDPIDDHGHGTHISGIIAAEGNNELGMIGAAWRSRIMPVKALDSEGGGWATDVAPAILYAARNGADIINSSWICRREGCPSIALLEDAVRTAYGLGVMLVFASGNIGEDISDYSPQNMTAPKPFVVGSSDPIDEMMDVFSGFGWLLDAVAPGGGSRFSPVPRYRWPENNILSLKSGICSPYFCDPDWIVAGNYVRQSGTSMSAAYASGLAALVMAYRPQFTLTDLANALRVSADDAGYPGRDRFAGYGRLNALKALQQEPRVFFSLDPDSVQEIQGNGDGRLNPGERGRAAVTLHNMWLSASNIQIKISNLSPSIRILNPGFSLPAMAAGERRTLEIDFAIDSNARTPVPFQFFFHIKEATMRQAVRLPIGWIKPAVIRNLPYVRDQRGDQANDRFGLGTTSNGIDALPDINGDGRPDYIVGASEAWPSEPNQRVGAAYVFSGADGSRIHAVYGQWENFFPPYFGESVANAGDVNGDGIADFIAGAWQARGISSPVGGRAQVFSGADGSLLRTFFGSVPNGNFGNHVLGMGDVNFDGFSDVAVYEPVPAELPASPDPRKIYLFSGRDGSVLHEFIDPLTGNILGWQRAIANAGDINRDGADDLALSVQAADPLYFTTMYQIYSGADPYPLLQQKSGPLQKASISSLARLGDVNHDGIPDLAVAYEEDYEFSEPGGKEGGKISVFSGRDGRELLSVFGDAEDHLGAKVGAVGDINCDSYPDFAAASLSRDPPCLLGNGRCPVYVYSGKNGQLLYRIEAGGQYANVRFFNRPSISALGDIDGDGSREFALGFGIVNPNEPGLVLIYSGDVCR